MNTRFTDIKPQILHGKTICTQLCIRNTIKHSTTLARPIIPIFFRTILAALAIHNRSRFSRYSWKEKREEEGRDVLRTSPLSKWSFALRLLFRSKGRGREEKLANGGKSSSFPSFSISIPCFTTLRVALLGTGLAKCIYLLYSLRPPFRSDSKGRPIFVTARV